MTGKSGPPSRMLAPSNPGTPRKAARSPVWLLKSCSPPVNSGLCRRAARGLLFRKSAIGLAAWVAAVVAVWAAVVPAWFAVPVGLVVCGAGVDVVSLVAAAELAA